MDEQAGVNLVSRQHDHHHLDFTKSNCTDAADHRSQFFSSVFASAPGRLVIPTIIMTSQGGTGNGNGGPGTGGGGGVQQAGPHQDDTTMMALNSECIVVPASDVGVVDRTHRQTSAKMHSGCPEVAATNVVPAANAVPAASCSHVDDSGDRGAAKRCLATMASASGSKATRAPRDVSRTAGRSLQEQDLQSLLDAVDRTTFDDTLRSDCDPSAMGACSQVRGKSSTTPLPSNIAPSDSVTPDSRAPLSKTTGSGVESVDGGGSTAMPNSTDMLSTDSGAHDAVMFSFSASAAGATSSVSRAGMVRGMGTAHSDVQVAGCGGDAVSTEQSGAGELLVLEGQGRGASAGNGGGSGSARAVSESPPAANGNGDDGGGGGGRDAHHADNRDDGIDAIPVEDVEVGDGEATRPSFPDEEEGERDCSNATPEVVASADQTAAASGAVNSPQSAAPPAPGSLTEVILKFTTVADGNEPPSFAIGREGATVGRGPGNDVCIPSDTCMGDSDHASIVWKDGAFHVQDRGHQYGAAVRIGTGTGAREWPLRKGAVFSAGNSVFQTEEIDEEDGMLLEIVAGPLKGQRRRVLKSGATVGRATENTISIADRELSRHHSIVECQETDVYTSESGCLSSRGGEATRSCKIEVEKKDGGLEDRNRGSGCSKRSTEYFLCDVGSTNGTYVQLVGPYASSRRLELSDRILIGRTGFSVNRFDWGIWEDRGSRRTMEDKSVVIQDMGVESLTALGLGPQTFLAVYDGHGGAEASAFLWQHLHVAIAEALEEAAPRIAAAMQEDREAVRKQATAAAAGTMAAAPADASAAAAIPSLRSSHDADGVFSTVRASAIGRGGGGGEAMRCADRDGEDGHGGDGSGQATAGPGKAAIFASGTEGLMASPAAVTPKAPASAAPAPAQGRLGGSDVDGTEGVRDGGKHSTEREFVGGGSGGDGSGGGGYGARPWRYGGCERQPASTISPVAAAIGKRMAMAADRQQSKAPSLPQEWLVGARASLAAAAGTSCGRSVGKAASRGHSSKPPLPTSWAEEAWDFNASAGDGADGGGDDVQAVAAGGEAAHGVRTATDGDGGQQGGGDRAGYSCDGAGHVSGAVTTSTANEGYESGGGDMSWDTGRESPPPPSGGRSGTQSPGGEPSRSLATAGLPAGGAGGAALRPQRGTKGVVQEPQTSAVDREVNEAVRRAFLETDEEFLQTSSRPSCGTTATTVMILGDRFYSFNLGDSRTVLSRSGRVGLASKDHKPNRPDEMERIKRAGGMVLHKRVMGELAVSRAFGDRSFKIGIKAILKEEEEARRLDQQRAAQEQAEMEADLLEQQREEAADAAEQQKEQLAQRDAGDTNSDVAEDDDGDDDDDVEQEEHNSLTMGRGIMLSSSAKDLMLALKPCKSFKHKSSQQQVASAPSASRTSSTSGNCSNSNSSSSSSSSVPPRVLGGVLQQLQRSRSTTSAFPTAEATAKNVAADSKLSPSSSSSTDCGSTQAPADIAPLPTATLAAAVVPQSPRGFPPKPPVAAAVDVEESAAVAAVPKRVPITDPAGSLITAEPEMLACTLTAEDEFVLLACDGLFDVFSSEEVAGIVREEMRTHGDTQRVCETLTRKAIDERYTQDNVSVVLVVLRKFW